MRIRVECRQESRKADPTDHRHTSTVTDHPPATVFSPGVSPPSSAFTVCSGHPSYGRPAGRQLVSVRIRVARLRVGDVRCYPGNSFTRCRCDHATWSGVRPAGRTRRGRLPCRCSLGPPTSGRYDQFPVGSDNLRTRQKLVGTSRDNSGGVSVVAVRGEPPPGSIRKTRSPPRTRSPPPVDRPALRPCLSAR